MEYSFSLAMETASGNGWVGRGWPATLARVQTQWLWMYLAARSFCDEHTVIGSATLQLHPPNVPTSRPAFVLKVKKKTKNVWLTMTARGAWLAPALTKFNIHLVDGVQMNTKHLVGLDPRVVGVYLPACICSILHGRLTSSIWRIYPSRESSCTCTP